MPDIIKWKVKKLDNLVIPLLSLYHKTRELTRAIIESYFIVDNVDESGLWLGIYFGRHDGSYISGVSSGTSIVVRDIFCHNTQSGKIYNKIILPALRESMGILEVGIVWDNDLITRLTVKDGQIEEIEL